MLVRLTLPRRQLFESADFDLIFKTGKKCFSQFFIFYYRPLVESEIGIAKKLGVAVAKKSTKTNVKKNWVKRLIRETYRLDQESFQGFQVMVLAKKDLRKATKTELAADLENLFSVVHSKMKRSSV